MTLLALLFLHSFANDSAQAQQASEAAVTAFVNFITQRDEDNGDDD